MYKLLSELGQELLTCHSLTFKNRFAGNWSSASVQKLSCLRRVLIQAGRDGCSSLGRVLKCCKEMGQLNTAPSEYLTELLCLMEKIKPLQYLPVISI